MKIDKYIDGISSIDLFSCFSSEQLKDIFDGSKYMISRYGKDEIIHFQNEICNNLDIVLGGKVAVQNIDENGNILTMDVFEEMDIIGAGIVFSSRNHYPMTIHAMMESTILHLNRQLIINLCQNNLGFMEKFLTTISDRSMFLTDKINVISLKTIREKLIDFLRYEQHIQNSKIIKLNITKKELAERLGIQRTSLSRELNKMRKDGLVEYDSKSITIKNFSLYGK